MQHRPTADLIQVLTSGGGVEVDATFRLTSDLTNMAIAARSGNATLILRGMTHRPTLDMMQIGRAGGGKVIFSA